MFGWGELKKICQEKIRNEGRTVRSPQSRVNHKATNAMYKVDNRMKEIQVNPEMEETKKKEVTPKK